MGGINFDSLSISHTYSLALSHISLSSLASLSFFQSVSSTTVKERYYYEVLSEGGRLFI